MFSTFKHKINSLYLWSFKFNLRNGNNGLLTSKEFLASVVLTNQFCVCANS